MNKYFNAETERFIEQLARMVMRTPEQISAGGEPVAAGLEQYAKQNAPWTDRTGNARRTLEGFQIFSDDVYYIGVCGNMSYSPDLEWNYGQRYAILWPTVREHREHIYDDIMQVISRNENLID